MSAFNQDNSRPKCGSACWAQEWGPEAKFQALGTSPAFEPTCVLTRPLSLSAVAEKAEAVSPPMGCLHLRALGRLKSLQGHSEQFHGRGLGLGSTVQI